MICGSNAAGSLIGLNLIFAAVKPLNLNSQLTAFDLGAV